MKSGKSCSNKWNKKSENTRDVIRETCPLLTLPKNASLSVISKVLNDHIALVESKTETTSASSIHYDDYSNCFPCYRYGYLAYYNNFFFYQLRVLPLSL